MGMASTDLPLVAPDCGVSQAEGDHPKSSWPPGFRFHPTDEELVLYYLKRKVCRRRMKLNMIGEIDVYKCEPWELPEKSLLQTGDKQWFFFSPRDKKYPNGARANRATKRGYWKATGKDRNISRNSRPVGVKKTLVFYDGRAPSKKRTDWVMHEYSMDEEELKTCNALQDSYALYKIYRKSGPGPKNGEQYGAPFREEEWSDDDHTGDGLKNTESGEDTMAKDVRCPSLDDDLGGNDFWSSMGNIEGVPCQLRDDPGIEQPHQNGHISEVNAEVGAECYSVDQLLEEALLAEGGAKLLHAYEVSNGVQNADLSAPLMHPCELPEVSSSFHLSEHDYPQAIEGNYFELHDLLDPTEPCASGVENNASEDLLLADMEGLFEPEFYHDAPLSFSSVTVAHDQQPNLDSIGEVNSTQLDDLLLMSSMDSGNSYHHHTSPFSTGELWTQDQNFNVFTSAESRHFLVAPSYSAYEGSSGNMSQTRHQQQSNNVDPNGNEQGTQGGDSRSWFTSAVYSFLDRIPSHPAAASENALINRALERMSSFGAIRIGAPDNRDVTAAASEITSPVAGRRRSDGNGGFFFISLIVLLWALLWVFIIGTAIKVFKAFTGRYISS